jgi:DeoR/GlpR family transcriptional regulator of sugar metabolism
LSSIIKELKVPELGAPVALKAALRHDTIRRAIEVDGWVSTVDLKYHLDVSEVTIRGDLEYLEAARVLTRIRGGAVITRDGGIELSLEQTSTTNRAEKMRDRKFLSFDSRLTR